MIMTCILLRRRPDAAGIQLPGYNGAQGTAAEGRLFSVMLYYITASDTESNLTTFLGEKALCTSECYQFLEQCEL